MIAVDENGPRLLQIKKDTTRITPGPKAPARIDRLRTEIQDSLGVEMVYVNVDTRAATVTDHEYHKAAANDNEKGAE